MTRADLISFLDKWKPAKANVAIVNRYPETYLRLAVSFPGDDEKWPEDPTGLGWYRAIHSFNHTKGGMTPKRAEAQVAMQKKWQRWCDEWFTSRAQESLNDMIVGAAMRQAADEDLMERLDAMVKADE